MKSILVTNNHLEKLGGSETFTYALIDELKKKGHQVEYFTFFKGIVSERIENDLRVSYMSKDEYDIVFANHNSTIKHLMKSVKGKFIQTCHGIYPPLERPYKYADGYISISEEVKNHLRKSGFLSKVILNGINTDRFINERVASKELKSVLSLCQSDSANFLVKSACDYLGVKFEKLDKNANPIWDVEKKINDADLVVGLGRSVYEAMACGRAVLIFDERSYSESYADGYLTGEKIEKSISHNCSGRSFKFKFDKELLIRELQKYNSKDGLLMRSFALEKLNIKTSTDEYLEYADFISIKPIKRVLFRLKMFVKFLKNKLLFRDV